MADAGQNRARTRCKIYLALGRRRRKGTFSMHDEVSILFSYGTAPNLLSYLCSPFPINTHQITFTNVQFVHLQKPTKTKLKPIFTYIITPYLQKAPLPPNQALISLSSPARPTTLFEPLALSRLSFDHLQELRRSTSGPPCINYPIDPRVPTISQSF
jgi:hypothetical protein